MIQIINQYTCLFCYLRYIIRSMRKKKKKKYVRTTVSLPENVWKELRIESVEKRIPMGELIANKIKELKELKSRLSFIEGADVK